MMDNVLQFKRPVPAPDAVAQQFADAFLFGYAEVFLLAYAAACIASVAAQSFPRTSDTPPQYEAK